MVLGLYHGPKTLPKLTLKPSNKPVKKGGSLEAVFAASGSLLVGGLAIVFSSQRSTNQRAALTGGVLGGAAGLLVEWAMGLVDYADEYVQSIATIGLVPY